MANKGDDAVAPPSRRAFMGRLGLALSAPVALAAGWPAAAGASAGSLRIGGTGAGLAIARLVGDAFASSRPGVEVVVVPSLGSAGGIKALAAGAIDVALSGRAVSNEERAKGVEPREWVRTPFVIVTPLTTPASGMTLEEVAAAYTGSITTWPDGTPLRLVLRPTNNSDNDMLRGISPAMAEAVRAALARPGLMSRATDQENLNAIEAISGSFGTGTLGQIIAERRKVKGLALDGVAPTAAAVLDGTYRLAKTLHLSIGREAGSLAREFAAFAGSAEAAATLASNGFLPPAAAA